MVHSQEVEYAMHYQQSNLVLRVDPVAGGIGLGLERADDDISQQPWYAGRPWSAG